MPPYGPRDPAEDLRIVRQSLLSTVGRLYNNDTPPPTPEKAIEIARIWEAYVYEPIQPMTVGNGRTTTPVASAPPALVCSICGAPLTEVSFKKGNTWTPEYLAQQGQAKYATTLCKQHYFGKKPATA